MQKELSLYCKKRNNVLFIIIRKIRNDVWSSEINQLKIFLMNDIYNILIVSDCDILTDVKKVFAEVPESFLYLLQLRVLFCEAQL
jgi:hypothetical protein